jgi:NAD(P)-dependent dehydrogenase (short-subunit alcohol dehydrogenase family)
MSERNRTMATDTMATDLKGKVALVTGAGSGLGEATARALGAAGCSVACVDINREAAERVTQELLAQDVASLTLRCDASDAADIFDAVEMVAERFGRLDLLVNCAAVDFTYPVEELSVERWDLEIGVNLRGPFLFAKAAFPLLRAQGGGHIVNIASTAATRAWANAAAYHASKWGLLGLSHALHVEGRPHGVKVTAVVAGGMRTPFLLERFPDLDPGVLQDPGHVAATVVFVLTQPAETVVPEVTVLPMRETSWP